MSIKYSLSQGFWLQSGSAQLATNGSVEIDFGFCGSVLGLMRWYQEFLSEGFRERLSRGLPWFSITARSNIRFIGPKNVYLIRKKKLSANAFSEFRALRESFSQRVRVPSAIFLSARMTVEKRIRFDYLLSDLHGNMRLEITKEILRDLTFEPRTDMPTGGGDAHLTYDGLSNHGDLWAGNVLVDTSNNYWIIDLSAVKGLRRAHPRFDVLTLLLHVPQNDLASLEIGKLFFLGEFDDFLLDQFQRKKSSIDQDQFRWSLALEWANDFSKSSGWDRSVLIRNLMKIRKS